MAEERRKELTAIVNQQPASRPLNDCASQHPEDSTPTSISVGTVVRILHRFDALCANESIGNDSLFFRCYD